MKSFKVQLKSGREQIQVYLDQFAIDWIYSHEGVEIFSLETGKKIEFSEFSRLYSLCHRAV